MKHTGVPGPASPSTVWDLLRSLVAFDTTSEKSNLRLIEFVRTYLDGFGIAATRITAPDGMKASLLLDPSANAASGYMRRKPDCSRRLVARP